MINLSLFKSIYLMTFEFKRIEGNGIFGPETSHVRMYAVCIVTLVHYYIG